MSRSQMEQVNYIAVHSSIIWSSITVMHIHQAKSLRYPTTGYGGHNQSARCECMSQDDDIGDDENR